MATPAPTSEQALQYITSIKLEELEKQSLEYQSMAGAILNSKKTHTDDDKESLLQRVELLIAAVTQWKGPGQLENTTVGGKLELSNLGFWMKQARQEVGFDLKVIRGWEETLEAHIRHTSARFDCAKLFGEMYNEWLDSDDLKVVSQAAKEAGEVEVEALDEDFDMMPDAPGTSVSRSAGPEEQSISSLERKQAAEKEKVLSVILDEYPTDTDQLTTYLDNLFATEEAAAALSKVRASLYKFGTQLETANLGRQTVSQAISGLLVMGLMNEKHRVMLGQISSSQAALQEVANVLQIRLVNLKSWQWPKPGLEIAMRKHINDKFRAFIDPEIIDAILWEYIGNAWRSEMKTALRKIFDAHAWNKSMVSGAQYDIISKIGPLSLHDSINAKRDKMRSQLFLLSNLDNLPNSTTLYNDFANMQQRETNVHDNSLGANKRKLLHLMTIESRLNSVLRGSQTMMHLRLEGFEHSLSHQAVLIVLAYLGVPEHWISFFHSFLAMPISLQGDTTHTCKRGVPVGYTLGVVFGEAVMHVMDFAVNQRADGLFLYRIQHDIWFWDANAENCLKAWKEMDHYASLVGIKFDEKTGVVNLGKKTVTAQFLPIGDVKWGFLKFDPTQVRFVIDQVEVGLQTIEFRRRLTATKSIFGWVDVYNKYMAHFWRNFGGTPAECLGDAHVDDMIKTFTRIHEEIFLESNVGPVGHLRKIVGDRFGVYDLPDGYFYFPFVSGGLEVYNVILSLTSLERERKPTPVFNNFPVPHGKSMAPPPMPLSDVQHSPVESRFINQFYNDVKDYNALASRWEVEEYARTGWKTKPMAQEFISFGDYISLRECHLASWGKIYDGMFNNLRTKEVAPSSVGAQLSPTYFAFTIRQWCTMKSYSKWVVSLYGEDVVKKFGKLDIVDKALIPVGMTDLCRTQGLRRV